MLAQATVIRVDGHWVIEIEVQGWVIPDILNDSDHKKPIPVELTLIPDRSSFAGTTRWRGGDIETRPMPSQISSEVIFKK